MLTGPSPDEPDPRDDRADHYVFDDEDLADIAAEVYVHLHLDPSLDETDAMEIADMVYSLMSGRWLDE